MADLILALTEMGVEKIKKERFGIGSQPKKSKVEQTLKTSKKSTIKEKLRAKESADICADNASSVGAKTESDPVSDAKTEADPVVGAGDDSVIHAKTKVDLDVGADARTEQVVGTKTEANLGIDAETGAKQAVSAETEANRAFWSSITIKSRMQEAESILFKI